MEKKRFTDAQLKSVYEASIFDIAHYLGFELGKEERKGRRVVGQGGLYIFVHGKGWYSHSLGRGGNVLDFAKEFGGATGFVESVKLVLNAIGQGYTEHTELEADIRRTGVQVVKESKILKIPEVEKDARRTFAYLIKTRGIDAGVVQEYFKQKRIFEVSNVVGKTKFHYVAFAGYDKDGEMKHLHIKSLYTDSKFRKDCEGSDKRFPFSVPGESKRLFVFESAIDAMSHACLVKREGGDWKADHRLSLGGTSDIAIQQYLKDYEIEDIVFCLDNDMESERKTGRNVGQNAVKEFLDKYEKLGYNVSNICPYLKDFNEDLKNGYSLQEEETLEEEEVLVEFKDRFI